MDIIKRCYQSWMATPDAGVIRVQWYWVNEPAPGVAFGDPVYTSSDWDPYPGVYPQYGELGYQRATWLDWKNGGPPPWPQTVPTGLAEGLGLAAARHARAGLGSGLGVGLSTAAAGYTRSLAATGNGAGLGVSGAVESRVSAAAGLGLAGGVATRTAGLAEAVSGLGSGEGSASPGVSREVSAAGLASALATVSSLSCRSQSGAGTATGVGTVSEVKGGTPACASCTFTPYQVRVTIGGATNGTCLDCGNLNSTWTLTYSGGCVWTGPSFTLCGGAGATISLHNAGGNTWQLLVGGRGSYTVTLGGVWNGRTSLTMTLAAFTGCNTMPGSVTVSPV